MREDRAADEAERSLAVGGFFQHFRAEDVGGHQIGRELDALRREAEHDAERLDEFRLGEAGHADEQPVAARQDRDERFLDHRALAEDHRPDGGAGGREPVERLFGGRHDGGFDRGGRGFG